MRWPLAICLGVATLLTGSVAFAAVDEQAALQQFQNQNPTAHLYQNADRITRVYGTTFSSGATPENSAAHFVQQHAPMLGVNAADLLPGNHFNDWYTQPVMYDRAIGDYKFTLVYYAHHRDGIPVFRSEVRLLAQNKDQYALVLAAANLRKLGDFAVDPAVVDAPFDRLEETAPEMTNFSEPETVIWAGVDDMLVEPKLAITFVADNYDLLPDVEMPEKWLYVADAQTGEVLYKENLIVHIDVFGNVSGQATELPGAEQCQDEVPMAMPYAYVYIDGSGSAYADANGDFVIPNNLMTVTVHSPMSGQYFYVDNYAGDEEELSQFVFPPGPADFMHNNANTDEFIRAQVNGYVQANAVRDFCLTYNPSYPTISTQVDFPVYVNRTDGYCPGNAWYDGSSINFCQADSGYTNTAFSSVIHHEYGHHMVASGGSGQGEYGEGMADSMSMLIAEDPRLGVGFYVNDCVDGIRNADNDCQYLAVGCSTCGSEIHACGQLLSGCIWSTLTELMVTEPADYMDIISNLTVNSILLHTGTGINDSIAVDFLTLDDDDGNIDNGTPHRTEICAGFGAHSIDCPPLLTGLSVTPADDFVSEGPGGGPFIPASMDYTVENLGPDPITYEVTQNALWLTVTNGSGALDVGQTATVTLSINSSANTLPDCSYDDTVNFINQTDHTGDTTRQVTLKVGTPTTVMDDDFQTDQGWTVGDIGDDATTGIWDRDIPEYTQAQPGADHTPDPGTMCWVTDHRAGSSLGDYDVDDGKTTLMSPVLDLSGYDQITISYYRWYSNDTGATPNTDVFTVDVSNDGGSNWTNVETVGPSGPETSGGWMYHEFNVADFVTPTDQVKLRFVAADEGSGSLVEAALDDFLVEAFACSEPYGVGDLNCDGSVNGLDIDAFVLVLSATPPDYPEYYAEHPDCDHTLADCSEDGSVNGLDIDPFVDLLTL